MSDTIFPNALSQSVTEAVYRALAQAEDVYRCHFPIGNILFNLRGRSAGQVRYPVTHKRGILPEMRFNPQLLLENADTFIREVVPHECAHLVVYHLYASRKTKEGHKPKPHGKEWKSVMLDVYGVEPRVTHSFDVKRVESKKFNYACACDNKIHRLSVIRHNKILRKTARYSCRVCGETLASL